MKKITTTLAFVGTVFVASTQAAAGQRSQYQQLRGDNADFHQKALGAEDVVNRFQDNTPILRDNQVPVILGAEDFEQTEHRDNCGGLDSFQKFDHYAENMEECGCGVDRWGCDAKGNQHHKPAARHIVENRQSVTATIVPVQAIVTNTTQDTTGDECHSSFGTRERNDVRQFQVEGNFKHSSYDVQQQCNTEGDTFCEEGAQRDRYWDANYDHDVECDCHDISGKDFLGFDNSGDCKCHAGKEVENPDQDIERRITSEVEKTISELLSEIVGRCISESISNIIEWH